MAVTIFTAPWEHLVPKIKCNNSPNTGHFLNMKTPINYLQWVLIVFLGVFAIGCNRTNAGNETVVGNNAPDPFILISAHGIKVQQAERKIDEYKGSAGRETAQLLEKLSLRIVIIREKLELIKSISGFDTRNPTYQKWSKKLVEFTELGKRLKAKLQDDFAKWLLEPGKQNNTAEPELNGIIREVRTRLGEPTESDRQSEDAPQTQPVNNPEVAPSVSVPKFSRISHEKLMEIQVQIEIHKNVDDVKFSNLFGQPCNQLQMHRHIQLLRFFQVMGLDHQDAVQMTKRYRRYVLSGNYFAKDPNMHATGKHMILPSQKILKNWQATIERRYKAGQRRNVTEFGIAFDRYQKMRHQKVVEHFQSQALNARQARKVAKELLPFIIDGYLPGENKSIASNR